MVSEAYYVDACMHLKLPALLTVTLDLFRETMLDCASLPAGVCAEVHTSKAVSEAPSTAVPSTCKAIHVRCHDDNDGEPSAGSALQHAAEVAKQRGNVLYQQAQFQQAISLYSVSTSTLLPCCAACKTKVFTFW